MVLEKSLNNEFLRICSWNVLEFYFSSFIRNFYSSFSWSIFLKWMPLYRFQILFYNAKTFALLSLLIFVFHEICLWYLAFLKKASSQLIWYFQRCLCSWKLLMCFWNVLELFLNFYCKNRWPPCSSTSLFLLEVHSLF